MRTTSFQWNYVDLMLWAAANGTGLAAVDLNQKKTVLGPQKYPKQKLKNVMHVHDESEVFVEIKLTCSEQQQTFLPTS